VYFCLKQKYTAWQTFPLQSLALRLPVGVASQKIKIFIGGGKNGYI